jgi:hypothetical protein
VEIKLRKIYIIKSSYKCRKHPIKIYGGNNVEKKLMGTIVCMLLIAATVIPVAGTMNETINNNQFADDFIKPSGKESIPIEYNIANLDPAYNRLSCAPPDYEFIQEPTLLMTSFYDYMPGSYASHPLSLQTDNGDGIYATFFGVPDQGQNRRQYWMYFNSDGSLQDWETITTYDKWQGYGSIAVHPATGDAIASWHEDDDSNGIYESATSYDDFDASETPGVWQSPMVVYSSGSEEYIWPYVYVGPSPLGSGYVRVYQVANNHATYGGNPLEDVRIMWIDVENENGADLSGILTEQNWDSVTVFTDWRPKQCRPMQAFTIDYNNPGRVAFIGNALWLQGDMGNMPVDEGAFVWESLDYGETWSYDNLYSDGPGLPIYYVENIPEFQGAPPELEVTIAGWHNTALYDSEGNLHMTFLQQYGYTEGQNQYYFPYFMPQAEMVWDGENFTFHEVSPMPGIDPLSGHTVPWDAENEYPVIAWSNYPSGGTSAIFHENTQKQAINRDNNWMAHVWVDSTYHQLGDDGDPQYEDYIEHPLIYIAISTDNGDTWFDPIELTDIFSEEFDFSNQITVYPYVCDQIVDLGDNWGQIYMYYMNDQQFGSHVQGTGLNPRGNITYCSLKIKFGEPGEDPELEITDVKGGLGKVQAIVDNTGDINASDIDWTIIVQGGILGFINVTTEGTIDTLDVGGTEAVQTDKFILGLGKANVTIEATYATTWEGTALVIGPFVLIL